MNTTISKLGSGPPLMTDDVKSKKVRTFYVSEKLVLAFIISSLDYFDVFLVFSTQSTKNTAVNPRHYNPGSVTSVFEQLMVCPISSSSHASWLNSHETWARQVSKFCTGS